MMLNSRPQILRPRLFPIATMICLVAFAACAEPATAAAKTPPKPYSYWGLILQSHYTEEFRQTYAFAYQGVLVSGVRHDSPAELSRIQPCDEILRINGQAFNDTDRLIDFVHQQPADSYFSVTLIRDAKILTLDSFIRWFYPEKGDARQLEDNFRDSFALDRCDLSRYRHPLER